MNEVSPHAFAVLRTIADRRGVALDALCAGLGRPAAFAADGLDWDTFCALCDRLQEQCGGGEALAREGACAVAVPELGPSIRILRLVTGCRGLFWANFRWGGPSLFRVVQTTFLVRSDGRYVGTIAIPPTHGHNAAFFHLCAGVFGALPRALGLPDAAVELSVSPRLGTYLIDPPRESTFIARLRWAVAAVVSPSAVIEQLAAQNERLTVESRQAQLARADAEVARERAVDALGVAEAQRAIAERERTEAEAARAAAVDALRLKSEFISTVSHELRTPLNGILGMNRILATTPLTADQRDCVVTIEDSGRVLLQLINDILDFSKFEAGALALDPVPTAVRELVEQVLQAVSPRAMGKPVDLVGHVAPDVPAEVHVDGLRLRQVLTNLVDNAVKFTARGEVVVSVRVVHALEGRLAFTVRDTGIGISDDQKEKIFQPFVQADGSTTRVFGGTGLGLTISTRLVGAMGGEIVLDSVAGEGSSFAFEVDAPTLAGPPRTSAAGRVRIVAPPSQAAALRAMLETGGWSVVEDAPIEVVDLDAPDVPPPAPPVARVGLARVPAEGSGAIRKPVRREELAAALARAEVAPVRALRVRLLSTDPLRRRITGRALTRLGHEVVDGPADVVVLEWAEGWTRPRLDDLRAESPGARVVALVDPGGAEAAASAGADGAVDLPVELDRLRVALAG